MKGRLFGVGVGPGDPELMTYKAVRTIEKCPVIAVPAKGREHAVSYRIAAGMVDNMEEKEYLDLDTPMTKDRQILNQNYEIKEPVVIYSIVDSLSELSYVSKVQIAVNGDTKGKYRDDYAFDTLYDRNLDYLTGEKEEETETE